MRADATITVVGGKGRQRPAAVIAVIAAATGALLWLVWQSPHRADLSTFGGFAVAVIVPAASLITYLAKSRRPADAGQDQSEGKLADALAKAVLDQWTRAGLERQLTQPEPIPVAWERSSRPLAGPASAAVRSQRFRPLPGLPLTALDRLNSGQLEDLHAVYGGLGSGRLVIVGAPGSGKSGTAVLLVLAALQYRARLPAADRSLVPVPVLLTAHGWDPTAERVGDWLAARLQQTYPLFAGKGGLRQAGQLVQAAQITLILDGLDEIPEKLRPPAFRALSEQAGFRVVLLGRSHEMVAAARHAFLQEAIVLELCDVTSDAAADYLLRVQRDPPPTGWGELASRLRQAPQSPISRALRVPLTLTLVRDTYRSEDDVGEFLDFCDADGGAARQDIEDYLLDRVLPAAYARRPGEVPPLCQLRAAQLALGQVAARMSQDGTRDLAWWRIPGWAPAAPRIIATGLTFGVLFLLGSRSIVLGLVATPSAALLYVLGGGLASKSPRRIAPPRWRQLYGRSSLLVGLQFALVGGVFGGLIFGLAYGPAAGRTVGLVAAAVTGLTGMLAAGLSQPGADDASPLTPTAAWRRDQAFGLVTGVVLGTGIGLGLGFVFAAKNVAGITIGLIYGLLFGLAFGLVWGLTSPQTWTTSLAFVQLAVRWHTPGRLLRFLDDARQRDVLRTVGPVYQFRHARLQDRLSEQAAAQKLRAEPAGPFAGPEDLTAPGAGTSGRSA
jgi:hypothetical protein